MCRRCHCFTDVQIGFSTNCGSGSAKMRKSEHPVVLKFPAHAEQISAHIKSNQIFAEICGDYADIVDEIARKARSLGHDSGELADLIELRLELENDILGFLGEADKTSAASEKDPST